MMRWVAMRAAVAVSGLARLGVGPASRAMAFIVANGCVVRTMTTGWPCATPSAFRRRQNVSTTPCGTAFHSGETGGAGLEAQATRSNVMIAILKIPTSIAV